VSNEYYDDPYMMGMEGEYTVVDYTQPTPSDYNSPNTDKSVAIVDQSPKYTIEETSIFVETITPPQFLGRDQQIEVLNLIEAGEIVSIEMVTDNPYIALYIEMDDFKYKTPNGMTAAELLLRGRDEYAERHFYVEGPRPDGMYVVKFHPRTDYKYTDRLKVVVRNDITTPAEFRGAIYKYTSRGSLPTPMNIGFNGGAVVNVAGNAAIKRPDKYSLLGPAVARGIGVEFTESEIRNDQFRIAPLELAGAMHPFVGNAGKIDHNSFTVSGGSNPRVVWAEPGVAATSTTVGSSALLTNPFPGSPLDQSTNAPAPSSQQFIIYASNAESETAGTIELLLLAGEIEAHRAQGDSVFYSVGDNVYYPGKVIGAHYYNGGTSNFIPLEGQAYNQSVDGALLITVSPGLPFTPPKADLSETGFDALGGLYQASMKYEAIVQEVNVKRKKKRILN
jgi:hypothetical protein